MECGCCGKGKGAEPRLLGCFHSVCAGCFADAARLLACPACGAAARIPARDPDNPVDFLARRQAHVAALQARAVCELGEHDQPEVATARCRECDASCCTACAHAHTRLRAFAAHTLVPLDQVSASHVELSVLCPAHNEPIQRFCTTCDAAVCVACLSTKTHGTHDVVDLPAAATRAREKWATLTAQLKAPEELEVSAAAVKARLGEVEANAGAQRAEIEALRLAAVEAANARAAALTAEVDQQAEAERRALRAQLDELKGMLATLREARVYPATLAREGTAGEVAAAARFITAQLERAGSVQGRVEPCVRVDADRDATQRAIAALGAVAEGEVVEVGIAIRDAKDAKDAKDTCFYVLGGRSSRTCPQVDRYDVATNTWAAGPPMPTARDLFTAATHSGQFVYAVGGYSSGTNLSSVERLDLRSRTWSAVAPMPTARRNAGTVVAPDGSIYAIGGWKSNVVERYDPRSNTWTTGPPMPTAREGSIAALLGNHIYVVGGNGSNKLVVERLDLETGSWAACPPVSVQRSEGAAVVLRGCIYVVSQVTSVVERFDPAANAWAKVAPLPTVYADGVCAVVVQERIYVVGGGSNTVQLYDPDTDTWDMVAPIPEARMYMAAAAAPL